MRAFLEGYAFNFLIWRFFLHSFQIIYLLQYTEINS